MTDRELLELAARAAGIYVVRSRLDDPIHADFLIKPSARNPHHDIGQWNPLTDDGDALRLAVKLSFDIHIDSNLTEVIYLNVTTEAHLGDPFAATRLAIVRAAADIGKTMP